MTRRYAIIIVLSLVCSLWQVNTPIAYASDTLQITPSSDGVQLAWYPDSPNEHHEILLEVAPGFTPALTTITSQVTPDSNHLPIVDDHTHTSSPIAIGNPVMVRGRRVVVATLQSRVYGYRNAIQRVTAFVGTISHVTRINEHDLLNNPAPFLTTSTPPYPHNGKSWRVSITTPGMQKIPATLLRTLGIASQGTHLGQLIIQDANGTMIPVARNGLTDNQLDTADALVFYAPPTNDRWNAKQTLWLRINDSTAGGMNTRIISDTTTIAQTSAYEITQSQSPSLYEPTIAGIDGDHWFMQRIRTDNTTPASEINITPTWKGTAVAPFITKVTISGNAMDSTAGPHTINLTRNNTNSSVTWIGVGAWQQVLNVTGTGKMRLWAQSTGISELLINTIQYARTTSIAPNIPLLLPQIGNYRPLKKLPTGSVVYDISAVANPVIMQNIGQPEVIRSTAPNQQILIVAPNGYNTPVITAGPRSVNTSATNVDALYIAPTSLLATLAPLVAYRNAQGITSAAIDVQQIYDGWSGGQVNPQAIRLLLQYIATTNTHVPHTIVLVGDGTVDPFDYRKSGSANINLIPPFLADVDRYMGESACDTCYVRLDGPDPFSDRAPDMSIGRISVRTSTELKNFIAKVMRYEQQANAPWQLTHLIATDDRDDGGDFPYFADAIAAQSSLAPLNTQRFYYDPYGDSDAQTPRYTNSTLLRQQFMQQWNNGAGLVTYIGHSNHYQWAVTDYTQANPFILNIWDVDTFKNGAKLPIVVSLACLSSAFQHESSIGKTIDEQLVFGTANGAIATWGSAGMELATGHNLLFYQFYRVLRDDQQPIHTIGTATFTGMVYLAASSNCCENIISAYTLLGDPLTMPRLASNAYMAAMTATPSRTPTRTTTATQTRSVTRTSTTSRTPTRTWTASPSRTPSNSVTPSRSRTPSITVTPSVTRSTP